MGAGRSPGRPLREVGMHLPERKVPWGVRLPHVEKEGMSDGQGRCAGRACRGAKSRYVGSTVHRGDPPARSVSRASRPRETAPKLPSRKVPDPKPPFPPRPLPRKSSMTALTAATRLSLSLIAGGAVANIYYNQPLLGLLAQVFGHDASVLVPTATLAGYGLGILGLVPLGDALPRRSLIVGQLLLLAAVWCWRPRARACGSWCWRAS